MLRGLAIRWREAGNLTFLVASVSFALLATGAAPSPGDGDPSRWSIAQWRTWRDRQIERILTTGTPPDGQPMLSRVEVILRCVDAERFLAPLLKNPDFLRDPARSRELGNFVSFIKAQSVMATVDPSGVRTHALGYDVSDREYWTSSARELTMPSLLKTQAFLEALSEPRKYRQALDLLDANNAILPRARKWRVLMYRSQFLKSTDHETYGRLLIVVPNEPARGGSAVDRWIQFSIATPEEAAHSISSNALKYRSISMVVVRRKQRTPGISQAHLVDFFRDRDPKSGKVTITPTMFEDKNPSKNCYECHKSPVLPIQPRFRYECDSDGRLVAQALAAGPDVQNLNARIAAYGQCDFSHMDTDGYGPSIGPADRDRSDAFIQSAAKELRLSKLSISRVRDAMNCASCHEKLGKLNYPQAVHTELSLVTFEQKTSLVQAFVENGLMPPNNPLTADERKVLWRSLDKEYFDSETQSGVLVDWLRGSNGKVSQN